ncbi:MAG: hypothetical protein F6K28_14765 [Microcoleus sp. SIO2G3]|nr:hypothetical protein [Microcoleus sp. SIO2G3]
MRFKEKYSILEMKINHLFFTLVALVLVSFIGFTLYKKFSNQSGCPEPVLANFKAGQTYGPPYKVIVQPWNGRHNVYAIFMVPVEQKSGKNLIVTLKGGRTYCGRAWRVGTEYEGIQAKPGYYLMKAALKTRTSSLLIAQGFIKQLKDPRNWNLV